MAKEKGGDSQGELSNEVFSTEDGKQDLPLIEKTHVETAPSFESMRNREQEIEQLGIKDSQATALFREYQLPGQFYISEPEGKSKIKIVRCLIDPEEYVVRVTSDTLLKLLDKVHQQQRILSRDFSIENSEPILEAELKHLTTFKIITGDLKHPHSWYRYNLKDIQLKQSNVITVEVQDNVEDEKGFAGIPKIMKEAAKSQEATGESPERRSIRRENLTPVQQRLVESDTFPQGLGFGFLTGKRVTHQRAPSGMFSNYSDVAKFELDLEKDNLWIVALSAEQVRTYWQSKGVNS